jgi:hypothetical protein
MRVSDGFRMLVGFTVIGLVAANRCAVAEQADASAQPNQLRWTPHRVATTAPTDDATPPAAAAAPAKPGEQPTWKPAGSSSQQAALPPASVTLPEGVPPVNGPTVPGYDPRNPTNDARLSVGERFVRAFNAPNQPRPRRNTTGEYAPLRGAIDATLGEWTSPNRLAGTFQAPRDPAAEDKVLGIDVMRTPTGDRGRPILAMEGARQPQARPTTGRPAFPVGGGEAPRFDPRTAQAARPQTSMPPTSMPPTRADRLAMNVDGLPSVMTSAPQAAAIGEAGKPGAIPAPPAAAPSMTLETLPSEMLPFESSGMPSGGYDGQMIMEGDPMMAADQGGQPMWMGQYPNQIHVESFYDDPYACEDGEECGCLPMWEHHDGRICAWLRRFGRPYYGWRWYRDLTVGAGVTSFTNGTDLGINGNYGANEYINWTMPFWNAFGIGWQIGARAVQTGYQPTTVNIAGTSFVRPARDQVFVTTGFFTRAFEGRGLQGGAVYDYLSDQYIDTVDVAQIRSELSYVWGYHEIGYWGAHNILDQNSFFLPRPAATATGTTVDFYSAFYRLHFGDANEWRVWGGATANGEGIFGSSVRAPMTKSFAMEGMFTYLVPKASQTVPLDDFGSISTFSPAAWNVSVNLVYYPACRSRRSLASPYRPLFDVADNGSLIRSVER